MANPSILMLSNLLKDLQENPHQPYLMGALRGAKNIFMPEGPNNSAFVGPKEEGSRFMGPEEEGSVLSGNNTNTSVSVGATPPSPMDDLQLTDLAPTPSFEGMMPPPIASPVSSPSVPPGGAGPSTTQQSGGEEGGFWHSSQAKDMGSLLASSLGGALGGAIGGNWRMGAAAGGMDAVKDIQAKQQDALKRMHGAWESAYNDAMALPAEVFTTPGLEPVIQAREALVKDLQDGKVDNKDNLANWLKAKAMYGKDIEDIQLNSKIADQNKVQAAQFQQTAALQQQEGEKWFRMAQSGTPEERQFAQAKLAELQQAKNAQDARIQAEKTAQEHFKAQQAQNAAQLGMQREGLNLQRDRLNQQDRLAQMGAEIRVDEGNRRAFTQQFTQATKMAASAGMGDPELAQQQAATMMREPILKLAGVSEVKGGNVIIQGKPVPLMQILGAKPENWDPDRTPSQAKGWPILLAFLANGITTTPVSRDLSLTGAFGNQSE